MAYTCDISAHPISYHEDCSNAGNGHIFGNVGDNLGRERCNWMKSKAKKTSGKLCIGQDTGLGTYMATRPSVAGQGEERTIFEGEKEGDRSVAD